MREIGQRHAGAVRFALAHEFENLIANVARESFCDRSGAFSANIVFAAAWCIAIHFA